MSDKRYSISDAILWCVSRRGLTPTARDVLIALWTYVDWGKGHTEVWPSRETLADRTGIPRQRVCAAVTELRSHGLVRSHGPRTSRLTLTPPGPSIAEQAVRRIAKSNASRSLPQEARVAHSHDHRDYPDVTTTVTTPVQHGHDHRDYPSHDHRDHQKSRPSLPSSHDHRDFRCHDHRDPITLLSPRDHSQILSPEEIAERSATAAAPVGATEDPTPLALIPPEQIEVKPPEPDPVDVVIARANALAERVNRYWIKGELRMPKMAPRPNAARKRSPSPRTMIADRIADYGIDDVRYTLERYASICVHEPEQRKWWCPDMFSPTRWPPIRSTVAAGTGKRFRHERDRHEWETRTAGRHDWPAVPRNVITYDDAPSEPEPYVPPDYMDDSKIPF